MLHIEWVSHCVIEFYQCQGYQLQGQQFNPFSIDDLATKVVREGLCFIKLDNIRVLFLNRMRNIPFLTEIHQDWPQEYSPWRNPNKLLINASLHCQCHWQRIMAKKVSINFYQLMYYWQEEIVLSRVHLSAENRTRMVILLAMEVLIQSWIQECTM